MRQSKYHNAFPAIESGDYPLITDQGAEITPSELLRRLVKGEPLGGSIYDDYDDYDDFDADGVDPLNRIGVELETVTTLKDLSQQIIDEHADRAKAKADAKKKAEELKAKEQQVESVPELPQS